MIEEYNLTDKIREKTILSTLAHQRAKEGRRQMMKDPNAFKEGYIDENIFQLYGPRRDEKMQPPEELRPKAHNFDP